MAFLDRGKRSLKAHVIRISHSLRRRLQLILLGGLCCWSGYALLADLQFRRDEAARLQQERWVPPSTITLGSRHMAELRELAAMVEAHVPPGAIIGIQGKPGTFLEHRRQLAICLGYLLPRHHAKDLRQRPRGEDYWLTVGHHLQRRDLERVDERPGGGLYRVRR